MKIEEAGSRRKASSQPSLRQAQEDNFKGEGHALLEIRKIREHQGKTQS